MGKYYFLTRTAVSEALRGAGGPGFEKLMRFEPEIKKYRPYASAGLTISPIGAVLPVTRTKHQIYV
jgi:hypothetical protein